MNKRIKAVLTTIAVICALWCLVNDVPTIAGIIAIVATVLVITSPKGEQVR
jgi:hypothetical protein